MLLYMTHHCFVYILKSFLLLLQNLHRWQKVLVIMFVELLNFKMLLPFSGIFIVCFPYVAIQTYFMFVQYIFTGETLQIHAKMLSMFLFCFIGHKLVEVFDKYMVIHKCFFFMYDFFLSTSSIVFITYPRLISSSHGLPQFNSSLSSFISKRFISSLYYSFDK